MHRKSIIPIVLVFMAALACNFPGGGSTPSSTPTPEATPTTRPPRATSTRPAVEPSPTAEATLGEATGVFRVAILVDLTSESVDREAAEAVLEEASQVLQERTGFVFELIDFHPMERSGTTNQMAFSYLDTLASQTPNGLVIFSYGDDGMAKLYGGYSGWIVGPDGYRNDFVSPVAGDRHVYLAVMHWSERYAVCGYGGGEDVVSETSVDGECRNNPGTACVQRYGYSMCATMVDDLYASTPTFFLAAGIVHEFMHPFGVGTSDDHYATPACKQTMGWTDENWTFSHEESQSYLNQCPNVYTAFVQGHQP